MNLSTVKWASETKPIPEAFTKITKVLQ